MSLFENSVLMGLSLSSLKVIHYEMELKQFYILVIAWLAVSVVTLDCFQSAQPTYH